MRILGVDPGTASTGYGIIEDSNQQVKVLDYGAIRFQIKSKFTEQLKKIYEEISRIIEQYHPDEVAIEDVFYSQNVKTALKLGQARGVALLAAVNHQIPISEYSAREVKQAVTGNGAASKEQVQRMVVELLSLQKIPAPFDVADALAVALCHCHRRTK